MDRFSCRGGRGLFSSTSRCFFPSSSCDFPSQGYRIDTKSFHTSNGFCIFVSSYRKPPLNQLIRGITRYPHADVSAHFILFITSFYFDLLIFYLFIPSSSPSSSSSTTTSLSSFPRILTKNDDIYSLCSDILVFIFFIFQLMTFLCLLIPNLAFSFTSYTTYNWGENGLWDT